MIVAEIGNLFSKVANIDYMSDRTFIGFDMVIASPEHVTAGSYNRAFTKYDLRKQGLCEHIKHYNVPLVIFAPEDQLIQVNHSSQIQVCDFFPASKFSVTKEVGHLFDVVSGTIFTDFLKKYQQYFSYKSYFSYYEGKPIMVTPTQKVLGFYNEETVFLPKITTKIKEVENDFLKDLYEVICKVSKRENIIDIPSWAGKYHLPNEKAIVSELTELREERIRIENLISEKEKEFDAFQQSKIVFSGNGTQLEVEVRKIFESIGCKIIESESGRSDLIISYNDRVAVVEIKGLKGSAAEKNSAQLEKWKILYSENNDLEPKGILVINSYREEELKDRLETTFPHQMLRYAKNRDQCLITTLQLMGLYYEIKNNENKEELIASLFDTVGVYNGFEKWQDFIEEVIE
jgi:hypothetical protein